ncbi:MAG: M28 family peptidase [Bacteroidetes bacterium]|nr:M28 family peptidase [Bacteroidota bacterium]
MRTLYRIRLYLVLAVISIVLVPDLHGQSAKKSESGYEKTFKKLTKKVDQERIQKAVYYLSEDPLSRRVLNWTRPGQSISSLKEADNRIISQLKESGYHPELDSTKVRAFGRDRSKPISQQYSSPPENSPYYTANNIIVTKKGSEKPDDLIIIIAHKDSQSWIESPGANDNAIGTCGALELALVLNKYKPRHTLMFIFCNEEHIPWTSVTAAAAIKASGRDVLALINMDGIGVKATSQAGQLTNVTRYTSPEGEKLADMMAMLNTKHSIGLLQSKYLSKQPGDDDGSFIKAGFPWSVLNIGSMPYGDPNYHTEQDKANLVDYRNAAVTVKLTLAAVLWLDQNGRPE